MVTIIRPPAPEPSSVKVDETSVTVKVGETVEISASVLPANATQDMKFTSLDISKATVENASATTGNVTGVEEGSMLAEVAVTARPEIKTTIAVEVIPAEQE
ncbi:Ig-like domain-containing protein [Listeria seeligeri]|uniref:Ig-like domain-containing protein n=1 Tax=Listeria seeligeri TaxID=1640 RepID=UPI0022EA1D89|nr:Ig-like domain-containing protein [Listeria seeligeri]